MKLFDAKVRVREQEVDGMTNWMWPTSDSGAWDGPSAEWERTHRDAYLKYCKKFDVVVQAGGNCGLYPMLFSKFFGRVYTFEPDALNFHCLVNNCQSPNIFKFNAALGDVNKLLFLFNGNEGNVGCHTVGDNGDRYAVKHNHVPTFTVDQLSLDQCDLIQLDCEGYEPKVIRGAINTIEKFRPVISMETTDASTEELLHKLGYIHMVTVGADKIFAVKD